MKNKLLIIGASGHGKVVADIALEMGKWEKVAFLDDNPAVTSCLGLDVVGTSEDFKKFIDDYDFFVAIGDNDIRKKVYQKLESLSASIPVLIHPGAVVGREVLIECGTVLMAGVIVNCNTRIGKGCILNTGSTVDHDNLIGDFVHVSPGVHLAGTVIVGSGSWLGVGSVIKNNVSICEGIMIGAGAVVVNDIITAGVYVGVPVRRVK
ncbi:acetyltransferase [Jeotgalibacillus haloalkalitolerans]|uniref:Acetyltransferase n=1 Tax=Jeotgalibacillus haloalkalitolerans TaxID=3104292 RepID=A0ABU5KJF4_9BACL|nr:acetyltransferase [Jeotgalibacillus sp. HH7-29]MDZ5711310.1 acetyltransferase [Jeotgalibacillus sp. HH7-29]